ncbi:MAG: transposase [Deltaproteobacteria bacterium]|nr:transposase [Deltaproteobacteria bacterium]
MSRPLRIEFPGAYYHVMNRGLAKEVIFKTDIDRQAFLDLLGDVHARWELRIYSYCLMSNHYHLCVQTAAVALARIMRHVDGVYTQQFNRKYHRDGPLFRGRYKAILVERDRYLLAVARYIHQNPAEAHIVSQPEQYHWSSLRHYVTHRGRPPWLDTETLLAYFGGEDRSFLEFMHSKPDRDIEEFYRSSRTGPILGSEGFKEWIKSQAGVGQIDREVPERRHLAVKLDTCVQAVARACKVEEDIVTRQRRGVGNMARQIAMYICREIGGYNHREIAKRLNVGSYSTVSSACALMKKRLEQDQALREQVAKIRRQLSTHYGHPAT